MCKVIYVSLKGINIVNLESLDLYVEMQFHEKLLSL